MKKVRQVMYWLSVILPLIDAIRGVKDGVKKAAQDAANDIARAQRINFEAEQKRLFDEANSSVQIFETKADERREDNEEKKL